MIIVQKIAAMRSTVAWWYALIVGIVLCGYAIGRGDTAPWRIAIGESGGRSFSSELGGSEFTKFYGGVIWFRHAAPGSDIGVPRIAMPRIVVARIFTRVQEPPTALQIHSERISFALQGLGQLRRYYVYVPANQTLRITCDTSTVVSPYLQTICASIVDIHGYAPTSTSAPPLLYMSLLVVVGLWVGLAVHVGRRLGATQSLLVLLISGAGAIAWYALAHYPIQLMAWSWSISMWLVIVHGLFWVVTHPRMPYHWVWGILIIAVALRLFVYSAPGVDGVDRKVHARQLESVIYGNIYLENIGNIVNAVGQPMHLQTYPYPPAVYLLITPLILLLSPVMTFNYYVGAMALIIDATLVFAVVWLLAQQRLGRSVAWYSAIVLLFFPQAYVFHSYPVVAQAVAQWASWWFVCLTVMAGELPSMRRRTIHLLFAVVAITGHFGAFLTMSVMQAIQWLIGTMRRAAWEWIGVTVGVAIIYYSQYLTLIMAQTENIVQKVALNRIDAFMSLWHNGVDDHYSWVVFVIGLLGLASPRLATRPALRHTLWAGAGTMALLGMLRVVFFVNPTRIIIFVAPIIAIGMGLMAAEYRRHRAGAVMMAVLCAYFGYISLVTWLTLNIDQQLIRWALPQ